VLDEVGLGKGVAAPTGFFILGTVAEEDATAAPTGFFILGTVAEEDAAAAPAGVLDEAGLGKGVAAPTGLLFFTEEDAAAAPAGVLDEAGLGRGVAAPTGLLLFTEEDAAAPAKVFVCPVCCSDKMVCSSRAANH
jgi:hypothetical protein